MKLKRCIIIVLITLTLFFTVAIREVKSESAQVIVIGSDGSVSDTDAIQHSGNVYSLTHNLYYSSIIVECNNIILDGKGYTLQGPEGWVSGLCAINLTCTETTVQNFNIIGFWEVGVLGNHDGNTICNNSITKTDRAISIYAYNYTVTGNYLANNDKAIRIVGANVNIYGNTIVNNACGFSFTESSANVITGNEIESNGIAVSTDYGGFVMFHNNFVNQTVHAGDGWLAIVLITAYSSQLANITLPPWDNGYPSGGNYWSDYASRYSNASEIGTSGIGDTPYFIGIESAINATYANSYAVEAVDRYPLLVPFDISQATLELPSVTPSDSPSGSPSPSIPEFPSWIILLFPILAVISLGLIAIFKKGKHLGQLDALETGKAEKPGK